MDDSEVERLLALPQERATPAWQLALLGLLALLAASAGAGVFLKQWSLATRVAAVGVALFVAKLLADAATLSA
jgi:hypothetical protein